MNINALKKLALYQKKIAQLERGLVKFNQQLAQLPAKFGFKSMADFIAALRQADTAGPGSKLVAQKSTIDLKPNLAGNWASCWLNLTRPRSS